MSKSEHGLTAGQTKAMLAIQRYVDKHGRLPKGAVLSGMLDCSLSAAGGYIHHLTKLGFIWRSPVGPGGAGRGSKRDFRIEKRIEADRHSPDSGSCVSPGSGSGQRGVSHDNLMRALQITLAALKPYAQVGKVLKAHEADEEIAILTGPRRFTNGTLRQAHAARMAALELLTGQSASARPERDWVTQFLEENREDAAA